MTQRSESPCKELLESGLDSCRVVQKQRKRREKREEKLPLGVACAGFKSGCSLD